MKLKTLAMGLFLATSVTAAHATLFTTSYGTLLANESNCDDCYSGQHAFGAGHDINFFGTTYAGLYTGSNGYVTFGGGASNYTSTPLNTQAISPMIAGLYTDLDARADAASNVYINNSTAGQLIITWLGMGHYNQDYGVRSTFQLVVRSDQFATPAGEGQIGFFYDSITDYNIASAGFGDGLAAVNPGEVSFFSDAPASRLSNSNPRWYTINEGVPTESNGVPEPATLLLLGGGLLGMGISRKFVKKG